MELDGQDIREQPLHYRKEQLQALVDIDLNTNAKANTRIRLSESLEAESWHTLAEQRTQSRVVRWKA